MATKTNYLKTLKAVIIISILSSTTFAAESKPAKPESPEESYSYYRRMGQLQLREKKYTEAKNTFEKALKAATNTEGKIRIYEYLGKINREQKDPEGYQANIQKAIKLTQPGSRKYAILTYRLINELLKAAKPDQAEKIARKAISTTEKTEDKLMLWERICEIYKQKGNLAPLIAECQKNKKGKQTPFNLKKLRTIYAINGNTEKVAEINRDIFKANPDNLNAGRELLNTLLSQNNTKEAIPILETLANALSDNRNRYATMLIEEYLKAGNQKAADKWIRFLKRPNAQTSVAIARLLANAGKPEQAINELNTAEKNANTIAEACRAIFEKTRLFEMQENYKQGIKECEKIKALKNSPDWAIDKAAETIKRLASKKNQRTALKSERITHGKSRRE